MSLIDEKVVTDAIAHLKVRYDGCTHQLLYDALRHIERKVKGASANGSSGKKLNLEKLLKDFKKHLDSMSDEDWRNAVKNAEDSTTGVTLFDGQDGYLGTRFAVVYPDGKFWLCDTEQEAEYTSRVFPGSKVESIAIFRS